jgi:purine-binding chemotaxis protein CheW
VRDDLAGRPGEEGPDFAGSFSDEEDDSAAAPVDRLELLSFSTGGEEYAVGVFEVREIIRGHAVTVIPRCPPYLLGVISLRGEIVPVLDLRLRLGLGSRGEEGEPMMVVVRSGQDTAGLLVERIVGMLQVPEADVQTTPEVVDPPKAEFFRGVVRTGDRLVTIIDVERVLRIREDFDLRRPGQVPARGRGEGADG